MNWYDKRNAAYFLRRVEKSYRAWGEIDNANQAHHWAEMLEADAPATPNGEPDHPAQRTAGLGGQPSDAAVSEPSAASRLS